MEQFLAVIAWLGANYQMLIALTVGLLSSMIAIALVIPGSEPEATLQKIVDFLTKFSKK